jgi:predicted ArsR family transcriptional regulator
LLHEQSIRRNALTALIASTHSTASGPKELVLRALETTPGSLDAYDVAKLAGVTPMQAGRTLAKLALNGVVQTDDQLGTENDLAARYRLVGKPA